MPTLLYPNPVPASFLQLHPHIPQFPVTFNTAVCMIFLMVNDLDSLGTISQVF